MLLMETSRRTTNSPIYPDVKKTKSNYSFFFYSGMFILCLFPILPNHPVALAIAIGGGVSLAMIREMASGLFRFVLAKVY